MGSKANNMIVLTGDIIHSSDFEAEQWLPLLEGGIHPYSTNYDIFRGDSFQALVSADTCFHAVFNLKASLRQIEGLDIRIGIGVGLVDRLDEDIKKSSGQAFVYSGRALDDLEKESLEFRSPWEDLNEEINLMMSLCTRITDQWTPNLAETVKAALENPEASQMELSNIIGRKHQSQVSKELSRAHYAKIMDVISYCTKKLKKYVDEPA
ncbi:hypothetical protein [Sphingobacterium lactis]|uniref:hypothetical protein n=1 Tax=Sphingobacterium lactis TaxID=797291 RepID=UPI003DA2AE6A